ncbi:MAG: redoxin domain-containing protein [Alphaproteobacteria bacterium]|nr:redoxin domain-containing protein [Alphaproteobacteria bacterium]
MPTKLAAGAALPEITLPTVGGGHATIGGKHDRWQAIFVYRGLHCPLCKGYLAKVQEKKDDFAEQGADILFVSGDPKEKAEAFAQEVGLTLPVAYGLSVEQMKALGLYVSIPRSDAETDRPFPEPGLFVANPDGEAHIVEISNAPFVRPELDLIVRGLKAAGGGYPIRGTMA